MKDWKSEIVSRFQKVWTKWRGTLDKTVVYGKRMSLGVDGFYRDVERLFETYSEDQVNIAFSNVDLVRKRKFLGRTLNGFWAWKNFRDDIIGEYNGLPIRLYSPDRSSKISIHIGSYTFQVHSIMSMTNIVVTPSFIIIDSKTPVFPWIFISRLSQKDDDVVSDLIVAAKLTDSLRSKLYTTNILEHLTVYSDRMVYAYFPEGSKYTSFAIEPEFPFPSSIEGDVSNLSLKAGKTDEILGDFML